MSISFVHSAGGNGNGSMAINHGHAVAVGDLLMVLVSAPFAGSPPASYGASGQFTPAVSDNVNTGAWNVSEVYFDATNGVEAFVAWIRCDTAGTPTVTVSYGSVFFVGYTSQYTGFLAGPAVVSSDVTTNGGTGTSIAATVLNNSFPNELAVFVFAFPNNTNLGTYSGNFTLRGGTSGNGGCAFGDIVEATAGNALSASGTFSTSWPWAALVVSFTDGDIIEGTAADSSAGAGSMTTGIQLAAAASDITTAAGVMGIYLYANAQDDTASSAALTTAILAAAAATDSDSMTGSLTNWASVVLAAPLYTGEGGILDPNGTWTDGAPGAGDTVYYDGTNMVIDTDGEIIATGNAFSALVQWLPSAGVSSQMAVVVTPGLASYADTSAVATGALSTGAGFASSSTLQSTAVGSLSTVIQLAAAAQAFSNAAAQLNTQINLQGAIQSVTSALGDLGTSIQAAANAVDDTSGAGALLGTTNTLVGNASDTSSGSAVLNTQVLMLSAATDVATAVGNLATRIQAGANAVAVSSAQASLGTGIQVSGGGSTSVTGAGILSTSINLVGAANSASAAAAGLLTAIQAVAAASDDSSGVGQLKTQIILSQAVTAVSNAVGALSTIIAMAAAAQDGSSASGSLTTKPAIDLDAAAADDSAGAGVLSTAGSMDAGATADSTAAGALRTGIPVAGEAADDSTGAAGLTTFLDPDANATDDTSLSGALSSAGSTLFTADVEIQISPQALDTEFGLLPIGRFYQRVGEKLRYAIDWTGWLAAYWKPAVQVEVGDVIRPWQPNGYQYRCVYPGVTGSVPPAFQPALNAIVQDGEAQWRCVPLDDTSLTATLSGVQWSAPQGVSVGNEQKVDLLSSAVVDTSGATPYNDYEVIATATASDGRARVGKIIIQVR